MIQLLETRRFLAVTIEIIDASDGRVMRIIGSEKRDAVFFGVDPSGTIFDVTYSSGDGSESRTGLRVADFKRIDASLGDAADTIILGRLPISAFVRGGRGPDSISGGNADDTLLGEGGLDYIFGRAGNDSIIGGVQGDLLLGGDGNDTLMPQSDRNSDDSVSGGADNDVVDYALVEDNVVVSVGADLPGVEEDDELQDDIETVLGSAQNDIISTTKRFAILIDGRAGDDTLTGGSGNDTLIGGVGADSLHGKGGRDLLLANDGAVDTLNGGRDSDSAVIDVGLDALFNLENASAT